MHWTAESWCTESRCTGFFPPDLHLCLPCCNICYWDLKRKGRWGTGPTVMWWLFPEQQASTGEMYTWWPPSALLWAFLVQITLNRQGGALKRRAILRPSASDSVRITLPTSSAYVREPDKILIKSWALESAVSLPEAKSLWFRGNPFVSLY